MQAKKAESLVWMEFSRLLDKDEYIFELQSKVRKLHSGNDESSENEKLKAKLYGVNSQLDALAERIAILPVERLVSIERFEGFKQIAKKTLLENPDFNIKRSILKKFIHRVEIGVESMKIYWNLDQENFESELKKKPEARDLGFLKTSANVGSQSLTNGAP